MNAPIPKAVREAMSRFGKLGGDARKGKLSKKRMIEIAKMGAKARHAKRNGKGGK